MTNQPAPSDTPTPRTDALINRLKHFWYMGVSTSVEIANFCKVLERELTRLSAEREIQLSAIDGDFMTLPDLVMAYIQLRDVTLAERDKEIAQLAVRMIDLILEIEKLKAELFNVKREKDAEIARLRTAHEDATLQLEAVTNGIIKENSELRARLAEAEEKLIDLNYEKDGKWTSDVIKLTKEKLTLESQCQKMRDALAAVQDSEFGGIECNDVNGQNWFDVRTKLLSAPPDLELLNEVKAVLELTEQDHLFPFTVDQNDLLGRVQKLLKFLNPVK